MEGSESEKVFDSLNLNPKLFVNEALNIVDELVDDAFDFFHQEAANLLKTEGTNRSEDLKEGVAQIKNMVQLTLDKRLSLWEKYCLHNCFKVPQGFSLPKADGPSGDTSFDINAVENPELDEKLDFLRNKISEVGKESAELNRELQALEGQSMLSGHSAASLTEALELYQQLAVNEKFEANYGKFTICTDSWVWSVFGVLHLDIASNVLATIKQRRREEDRRRAETNWYELHQIFNPKWRIWQPEWWRTLSTAEQKKFALQMGKCSDRTMMKAY
nr:uncharacterized LOC104102001 isoform X1 [Nicotiana tomentosiformis]